MSTDGSPWRWDRLARAHAGAIITKNWLTLQVCIPPFTPSALLLLCSSPPPLPSPPRGRSDSGGGGSRRGSFILLNGLSAPGLHDTDSSRAPRGPQQRLVKRCSVIICAVTAVIFYRSDISVSLESTLG